MDALHLHLATIHRKTGGPWAHIVLDFPLTIAYLPVATSSTSWWVPLWDVLLTWVQGNALSCVARKSADELPRTIARQQDTSIPGQDNTATTGQYGATPQPTSSCSPHEPRSQAPDGPWKNVNPPPAVPEDVIACILEYLPRRHLYPCLLVNSSWYALVFPILYACVRDRQRLRILPGPHGAALRSRFGGPASRRPLLRREWWEWVTMLQIEDWEDRPSLEISKFPRLHTLRHDGITQPPSNGLGPMILDSYQVPPQIQTLVIGVVAPISFFSSGGFSSCLVPKLSRPLSHLVLLINEYSEHEEAILKYYLTPTNQLWLHLTIIFRPPTAYPEPYPRPKPTPPSCLHSVRPLPRLSSDDVSAGRTVKVVNWSKGPRLPGDRPSLFDVFDVGPTNPNVVFKTIKEYLDEDDWTDIFEPDDVQRYLRSLHAVA